MFFQANEQSNSNSAGNTTTNAVTEAPPTLAREVNSYFPHPYLNALAAVIIFLLLGKLVDWIVTGVLSRMVGRTKTDYDDKVLKVLHRPIFLSVLLAGLMFATYLLEQNARITQITVHVLQTIAVFVWFQFSLKLTRITIEEVENNDNRFKWVNTATAPAIQNAIYLVLAALSVYAVFLIWDINITAWIASAGIIGLAVSFAAKDTLANVFGGIAIFADKPFKVGDYIILSSGERGVITQIGVRSTRILTRDDVEITVPNGVLATTTVINESGGPHEKYRIRVKVGVAYGSDIDKVEEVLMDVANNHHNVCEDPEPRVRFRNFGDSSLDYELLCWVERPVMRGLVLHEVNREVYKAFNREGISIPFPQRDLHVKEMPGN